MATVLTPSEEKIILHNVGWETYEHLLADFDNQSAPRLTFDRGVLEIMSPLPEHEEYNRTLSLLVEILAEEWGINVRNLGSTTFRREDLARGFEPDSCFYIQNEARISGKPKIDLTVDPPPDLVVEIDITQGSLDKFPIYARIGIPEIWRYDGKELTVLQLEGQGYMQRDESSALPRLPGTIISGFMEQSKSLKRTVWLRTVREWLRKWEGNLSR